MSSPSSPPVDRGQEKRKKADCEGFPDDASRQWGYWVIALIGLSSPAIAVSLRRFMRQVAKKAILEVPFSRFLHEAKAGHIAQVVMHPEYFDVWLKPQLRLTPPLGAALTSAMTSTSPGAAGVHHIAEGGLAIIQRINEAVLEGGRSGNGGGSLLAAVADRYRTRLLPMFDRNAVVDLLLEKDVVFGTDKPHWSRNLLGWVLAVSPIVYLAVMVRVIKKLQQNPLGDADSDGVGKSVNRDSYTISSVSFADVAGVDEAKVEVAEVVDFLRHPDKYEEVGARLPKGVLLSGPSGTGKTLLARAVAAESRVPFISCSASDFVEMLVGRGAARVRNLFQRGSAAAPCIIFIDELDALAKVRGGVNSNDEREQTLNQLLTEMDGFDGSSKVVVIAATNRPEVLDPALTRPGRFDRHVSVPLPNTRGRLAILKVHCRKIRMAGTVDLGLVARETDGLSGAELENLVNEAALLAVRGGCREVLPTHFEAAVQRSRAYRKVYALPSFLDTLVD